MFTDHIIFYAVGCWLPFEMIQTIVIIVSWLPPRKHHDFWIIFVEAWLDATALFQYSWNQSWIITLPNYVFEWLFLVLFVAVLWNVWIFDQCFFPRLDESFLFLGCWFEGIGQLLGWKISRLFLNLLNHSLFLLTITSFSIDFLAVDPNFLGTTLCRVRCHNRWIFFLQIIFLIYFEFVIRLGSWCLLSRFQFSSEAVFVVADGIQIGLPSYSIVFCRFTLPMLKSRNIIQIIPTLILIIERGLNMAQINFMLIFAEYLSEAFLEWIFAIFISLLNRIQIIPLINCTGKYFTIIKFIRFFLTASYWHFRLKYLSHICLRRRFQIRQLQFVCCVFIFW